MPTRTLSPLSFAALIAVPVALLTPKFFGTLSYALEAGQATVAKEELATTVKDISRAFQTVAKALRPSVVNVSTVRRVKVGDVLEVEFRGCHLTLRCGDAARLEVSVEGR